MKISRRKNLKKGFTLAEMLVVVAIIGILLAVAIPNVISYYRTLKLTELDDSARTIFLAAQNELTALKNKGDAKLQNLANSGIYTPAPGGPAVPRPDGVDTAASPQQVVYVNSSPYSYATDEDIRDTTGTANDYDNVLVLGSIETEIQGNHYVIEYNPKYGTVYAVWYWEKGSFDYENDAYKSSGIEKPEEKNSRLPKMVGYYGGSAIDRIDVGQMPFPTLDLINAEELRLVIGVPTGTPLTASDIKVDIDINGVAVADVSGFNLAPDETATIVLDTLNTAGYNDGPFPTGISFTYGKQYKDWLTNYPGLPEPGQDLTITVAVRSESGKYLTQTSTVVVNSLFADVAENAGTPNGTYTAQIAYGRHLQNLDEDTSGVTGSITAAMQIGNIDFKDGITVPNLESWDATYTKSGLTGYDALPFNAINNTHLTSFNGNDLTIRNLNVVETGTDSAGLFGSFGDSTGNYYIDRVTLINAKVNGTGSVGALAGEATNTDVNGCKVYIDDNLTYTGSAPTAYLTTTGGAVGGLIGTGGTVNIANSFASTVEQGAGDPVGGLVGRANGASVQISGSYAAGYLDGTGTVGGLIGSLTAGTANIGDSYAAGIIAGTPTNAGGLIGDIGTSTVGANNAYAAVRYAFTAGASPTVYGAYNGAGTTVYYVKQSSMSYETNSGTQIETGVLAGKVGTSFGTTGMWNTGTNDLDNTHAYKLIDETKSLGTTNPYPYPMLMSAGTTPAVVPQYGDWLEDDDEGPMMAYIELYDGVGYEPGVYALEKTNASGDPAVRVNTLQHGAVTIVDDFYRVISTGTITNGKFTLDGGATEYDLKEDPDHPTIESKGKTYHVYTLENATGAAGWDSIKNYYHKIVLSSGETYTYLYNPFFACEAFDVTEWAAAVPTIDTTTKLKKLNTQGGSATPSYTGVVIRSARQLANVAAYTTEAGAPKDAAGDAYGLSWTYDQVENVDFSTYTGSGLTVGKSAATTALTPAKLTTGKYDGHAHTVSNLYIAPETGAGTTTPAGLFESVTNGEIVDLELVNVSVKGGNAVATGGLVGSLSPNGTVNNCGIYVKATTGKDVTENYGIFTVTGSGDNGVGGLIGHINGGTVINSFAAVKVVGEALAAATPTNPVNPVGGFVGLFNSGKIENCYAGGFVDKDSQTYKNDSVNVTGHNNVGGFAGSISSTSVTFEGINYSTASVGGGASLGLFAGASSYGLPSTDAPTIYAISKAFDDAGDEITPRDESAYIGGGSVTGSKPTAVPYNQDGDFPYESKQEEHHGDWIEVEVMGLYHDTVNGNTGYYANGDVVNGTIGSVSMAPLATSTPGSGEIATDDGYMFVSKEDLGEKLKIKIGGNSYELSRTDISAAPIEINGTPYKYRYDVPPDALNAATDNYYTAISINGKIFHANFGVACEIFDVSKGVVDKPWAKNGIEYEDASGATQDLGTDYTGVVVRSARQLANIGIATNNGTKAGKAMQGMRFEQVLDIDFGEKGAPKYNADKLPTVKDKTISGGDYNHVPITLTGKDAGYYGHGYTVRNLRPGALVDGGFAENGMFGSVKDNATLDGITLVNARVVTDGADNGVMGDGASSTTTEEGVYVLDARDLDDGNITNKEPCGTNNYFTILPKTSGDPSSVASREREWSNSSGDVVYKSSKEIKLGTTASTSAASIQFKTKKEAIVKIWWRSASGKEERTINIFDSSNTYLTAKGLDTQFNICVLNSPGTYYIGGKTDKACNIYRVEVYENNVVYDANDPTSYVAPNSGDAPAEIPDGADISGKKVRAGALAGIVDGASVNNCGAYVEYEIRGYDSAGNPQYYTYDDDGTKLTNGSGKEAYDRFIVKNAFSSGNEDYIGGLIGNVANAIGVTDSYAAVKVLGVRDAGGFAGQLGGTTTVTNCYVGGHTSKGTYYLADATGNKGIPIKNVTTSDKTNPTSTGGFAGKSAETVTFSGVVYTTASVGMAENTNTTSTIGSFIGTGKEPKTDGDTTLYATGTMFRGDTGIDAGQEVSFKLNNKNTKAKFGQAETYLDETVTMRGDNVGAKAAMYDDALATMNYPYLVANDKTADKQEIHHGDWPVRVNFVYYELYRERDNHGNTQVTALPTLNNGTGEHIGVYGVFKSSDPNVPDVVNTLITKGYVYESGYMITAPIEMEFVDFRAVSRYTKEGVDTYSWTSETVKLEDLGLGGTGPLGQNGDYCYLIPAKQLNKAPSDDYYMRAYVNGGLYLINPHFACEILNVTEVQKDTSGKYSLDLTNVRPKVGINFIDENDILQPNQTIDGVIIRSAWNFASIARYSRPSNNGKVKEIIGKQKFYQLLDIDYTKYKEGGIYDGNDNNRIKDADGNNKDMTGSSFIYGNVPIILDGGEYEGYNHTISNVYLSNDSGNENNYVGLFGTLKNRSEIRNLTAENIYLTTGSPNDSKNVYMGVIAASVDGGSTIKNVKVQNATFDLHKVPVLTEVKDSSNKNTLGYKWNYNSTPVEVSAIGGIVGNLINGSVEGSSVDVISIDLDSGKYYYLGDDFESDASKEDEARRSLKEYTELTKPSNAKQANSVIKDGIVISIGGAIGEIKASASGDSVSVTNVTVKEPTISGNKDKITLKVGGAIGEIKGSVSGACVSVSDVTVAEPTINGNKGKTLKVGGAIGDIDVSKYTGAKATVDKVYVTDAVIDVSAGEKNIVGGVIGRADGKVDGADYDATAREAIVIRDSGVYLTNAVGNKIDNFNTKYGVLANEKSDNVGGFVGRTDNYVTVTSCFSAIRVEGKGGNVGGFAGDIEGSVIDSCYSGGHTTLDGKYDTSATATANVTGGSGATGGFAGKIENSDSLELKGIIYTTSSVTGTGNVGLFQGGNKNTSSVKNAIKADDTVVYAVGKAVNLPRTANKIDESAYLHTGASVPGNKNGAPETVNYDPTLNNVDYPYANSTKVSATGAATATHYGDWEEYGANAAFYWEREGGKYHFYAALFDNNDEVIYDSSRLCLDRDGQRIDAWGYGVFSSDDSVTISLAGTGLVGDTSGDAEAAKEAVMGPEGFGTAKTVMMIQGATVQNTAHEVEVDGDTFYINPAYAAAVEYKADGMTASTLGKDTPYQIRTVQQLANIGNGNTSSFEQSHDVVFEAGESYTSITSFQGHFNGKFYRILDITAPVFDSVVGSPAVDPTIENVIVYAPTPTGYAKTISGNGGLANSTSGNTLISNTIVAGFTVSGSDSVGGLVGEVKDGSLKILQSEATNKLTGSGTSSNVGGLVGSVASGAALTIEKSYAGGEITSATSAGGLVGSMDSSSVTGDTYTYKNVYSYVKISGATTVYGIGPGTVDPESTLQEYWDDGIPSGKTASDTGANINGVSLAQIRLDTRKFDSSTSSVSADEFVKPDSVRANGLENLAKGKNETEKFDLFPFAAFVTGKVADVETNYHYGEVPKAQYAGLFYWEKEVIHHADGSADTTEYHYYAYGGEIKDKELNAQKLLDTLCYDHHLNGERASIVESGYGAFYSDVVGAPTGDGVTIGEISNADVKNGIIAALGLGTDVTVKSLSFADVNKTITIVMKPSADINGKMGDKDNQIRVYPAFGAAIDMFIGSNGGSESGMGKLDTNVPIQIRTYEQLKNLANVEKDVSVKFEYSAIRHDIDASGKTDFEPISNGFKVFDGGGYRILDLNINATGDAALFSKTTSNCVIENVILYSTDGKGVITSTDGNAAGILASGAKVQIENCAVVGYTITGKGCVGGIVGDGSDNNDSYIKNCQAVVTLDGSNSATNIGGIAGKFRGKNDNGIVDCYAGGKIVGASSATIGGIVGGVSSNPVIKDSYSYMDLMNTGATASKVNALGPDLKKDETTGSYYLKDYLPSGAVTTDQGTPKTVDEMMAEKKDDTTAKYVYVPKDKASGIKGLVSWGDKYPFAAKVTVDVRAGVDTGENTGKVTVHYGAWPEVAGVAQWELSGGNYKVWIVGVDLMGNKLDASLNTGDLADEVEASGFAVFKTTNEALTIGDPPKKDGATEYGEKAKVLEAINAALSKAGVNGVCNSDLSKVYDNKGLVGAIDKEAPVTVSDPTNEKTETLYYNPGTNGIGYTKYDSANAIKIRTAAELDGIPNSGTSGYTFHQMCDIDGMDYTGKEYEGYTGAENFAGIYDGQGYKILELSMSGDNDVGLFASAAGGEIKNVVMYSPSGDATISGGNSQGSSENNYHGVGGIAGRLASSDANKITNCVVAGYTISGADYVGGIVGYAFHGGTITDCASVNTIHSSVTKNGTTTYANGVGGIVGGGDNNGTYALNIYNSYAGGTIDDCGPGTVIGGVYGENSRGGGLTVQNCYIYVDMSKCDSATDVYTIIGDIGATLNDNYYLKGNSLYPTLMGGDHMQGAPMEYGALKALATGTSKATSSYVPKDKKAGSSESSDGLIPVEKQDPALEGFPFPAVVKDKDGNAVHYGMWPTTPAEEPTGTVPSGSLGVFLMYGVGTSTTSYNNSSAVGVIINSDGSLGRVGTRLSATNHGKLVPLVGVLVKNDVTEEGLRAIAENVVIEVTPSGASEATTFKITNFLKSNGKIFGNESQFDDYDFYLNFNNKIDKLVMSSGTVDCIITVKTGSETISFNWSGVDPDDRTVIPTKN